MPAGDSEVLESLPRSLLSGRDELRDLRQQLAANPKHAELAGQIAQRYLQMGSAEGDPRFYGYARAAIGPWWTADNPPPTILKLRAKLKEKDHLYEAALSDLRQLAEAQPRDAQTLLELANIYRVQGRYAEAQQVCDHLREFAGAVPIVLCQAPLQAVTGQAEEAYASLVEAKLTAKEKWPSMVPWILTMQAQIARALGRDEQAKEHYLEGLADNPNDYYKIRAYADLLLDAGRNQEALALVRDHVNDNGLLLAAAIAARRCGKQELASEWQAQLGNRFEEVRLRGSEPHGRFEARYWLELMDDPERALSVALANWNKQKETRDTRNVLEAAAASREADAAQPVIEFLNKHGTENVVFDNLISQLERL